MKRLLLIFSVLLAGSPFLTSCKKLKDDIKDLKSQVSDLKNANDTLKSHNSALQEKLNGIVSTLGSDEPITATTTFQDNTGATRTISGVYKFKASDSYTQSLVKNSDGTYDIYIERFSDVEWIEGAWVSFIYNPATKAVTELRGGQYWNDYDPYTDRVRYDDGPGLTKSVALNSINLETGAISLKFSASGTSEYTNAADSWKVPNRGTPVSTTLTFEGKLKLFNRN